MNQLRRDAGKRRRHGLAAAPQRGPAVTTEELDPLIHVPTRLRIVATLAALPDGDALSFTRLQDRIGLTPGNLLIHLRKLEEADYLSSEKSKNGTAPKTTTVSLTDRGRAALDAYTQALRDLLGGL
jgi:DNA-binding MarR family transcriptional regulator